ncbi:MAG TPA: Calx-beta domain-containing protein [Verrucomicrobiota bacterium]|nr:Calx-beta domain-containing protein [Verrucomicrobiota bacterium]
MALRRAIRLVHLFACWALVLHAGIPEPIPGPCAELPARPYVWFRGEGDSEDAGGTHPGLVVGGEQYAPGRVGQAFVFTGQEELRVPGSAGFLPAQYTVEAWVYPTLYDGWTDTILSKESSTSLTYQILVGVRGPVTPEVGSVPMGHLVFALHGVAGLPGDYGPFTDGGVALPTHEWSHVALAVGATSVTVYVNGALTREITGITGQLTPGNGDLVWGGRGAFFNEVIFEAANDRWNGMLDEVTLHERCLSPAEILAFWQAGSRGKCLRDVAVRPGPTIAATVGQSCEVTLTVTNMSPEAVPGVRVHGVIPGNVGYMSGTSSAGTVEATPDGFQFELAMLPSQSAAWIRIVVMGLTPGLGILEATLDLDSPDFNSGNNAAQVSVQVAAGCSVPAEGLVGWWRAEDTLLDSVSGVDSGAGQTYGEGRVGRALTFAGRYEMANLGNPVALHLQDFTLDAWIRRGRTDRITDVPSYPAAAILSAGAQRGYTLALTKDGQLFLGRVSSPGLYVPAGLTDTNWHHVAVTKAGTAVTFYRDGLKVGAGVLATDFQFQEAFTLGNVLQGWPMGFVGQIDEMAVHDRPLSAAEIASICVADTAGRCIRDLDLGFENPPSLATVGEPLGLRVRVRNIGREPAPGVIVSNTLPAGFEALSATPSQGVARIAEGLIVTELGEIAEGASATVDFLLRPTVLGWATNRAEVIAPGDFCAGNNTGSATVSVVPPCHGAPDGLVGWWRGNGDFADATGFSGLWLYGTAGFTDGMVGQGFALRGDSGVLGIGPFHQLAVQDFTVEAWVRRADLVATTHNPVLSSLPGGAIVGSDLTSWSFGMLNDGRLFLAGGAEPYPVSTAAVMDLEWHHVAVVKSGPAVQFYVDGADAGQGRQEAKYQFACPYGYVIGGVLAPNITWQAWWGDLDEIAVYNRPLDAETIRALESAGKCANDLLLAFESPRLVLRENESADYRLTVHHKGDVPGRDIVVTNVIPARLVLTRHRATAGSVTEQGNVLVWEVGTLPAADGTATLEFTVQAPAAGVYPICAAAAMPLADFLPANNRTEAVVNVLGSGRECLAAPRGLVSWWRADGTAADESSGASGTLLGNAAYAEGLSGSAFRFHALGDAVALGDDPRWHAPEFTVEGWIRVERPEALLTIMDQGSVVFGGRDLFQFGVVTGGHLFASFNHRYGASPPAITDTNWHHVAWVKDGDMILMYGDGVLLVAYTFGDGRLLAETPFAIGGLINASGKAGATFPGRIDELAYYNRPLDPHEIQALATVGAGSKCRDEMVLDGLTPPQLLPVGEETEVELRVENRGSNPIEGVMLTTLLPAGVECTAATNSLDAACAVVDGRVECPLGTLTPNAVVGVSLRLRPTVAGRFAVTSVLSRDGRDLFEHNNTTSLDLAAEPLEVSAGPDVSFTEPRGLWTQATAWFSLKLNLPIGRTVSVMARFVDGTARRGEDYLGGDQRIVFPPGITEANIGAQVFGDLAFELPETFQLVLSDPRGAILGRDRLTCVIRDDDPKPQVVVEDAVMSEGSAGTNAMQFVVRLTGNTSLATAVNFTTAHDLAGAETDFVPAAGQLVFAPGETHRTVDVEVIDNSIVDGNRHFLVLLSLPSGDATADLADAEGVGIILDDDVAPGQVARFAWDPMPEGVAAGDSLQVGLTALDALGLPVTNYRGPVQLSARAGSGRPASLVLSEITVGGSDAVECQNVTDHALDVSGWTVHCYDLTRWPAPRATFVFPSGTEVPARSVLTLSESGTPPGAFPAFRLGAPLIWGSGDSVPPHLEGSPRPVAVWLFDAAGRSRDFFCGNGADAAAILVPRRLSDEDWRTGSTPLEDVVSFSTSFQRWGRQNNHALRDWQRAMTTLSATNSSIALPFRDALVIPVEPAEVSDFVDGRWEGRVRVLAAVSPLALVAEDQAGHEGCSTAVPVHLLDDLAVSLRAMPDWFTFGSNGAAYVATVTNPGPSLASGVSVRVFLDAALGWTPIHRAIPSSGSATVQAGANPEARATFDELGPGQSASLVIELRALPTSIHGLTSPRILNASATLSAGVADGNPDNDEAVSATEIVGPGRPPPAGLVGWWPAEEDARDLVAGHEGTLGEGVGFTAGRVGMAFSFPTGSGSVVVADAPDLNVGAGEDFSVETWLRLPADSGTNRFWIAGKEALSITPEGKNRVGWALWTRDGLLGFRLSDRVAATPPLEVESAPGTTNLRDGRWHHVGLTVCRTIANGGGVVVDGQWVGGFDARTESGSLETNGPLRLGGHPQSPGESSAAADVDELSLYHRALSLHELRTISHAGPNGKTPYTLLTSFVEPLEPGVVGRPYRMALAVTNTGPISPHVDLRLTFDPGVSVLAVRTSQGALAINEPVPGRIEGSLGNVPAEATVFVELYLLSNQSMTAGLLEVTPSPRGRPDSRTLELLFEPDSDGDGMPDSWEDQYRLDPEQASDAAEDSDGDGMVNRDEFEAGTSPEDPASCLRFERATLAEKTILLRFAAQPRHSYWLEKRGDGETVAAWQLVSPELRSVQGGTIEHRALRSDDDRAAFYRIRVCSDR